MKICFYGAFFVKKIINELAKEGHEILYNTFSPDASVVIAESHSNAYKVYRILRKIKKYNVKLINIILDIPPWRLDGRNHQNSPIKYLNQQLYHTTHKFSLFYRVLKLVKSKLKNRRYMKPILKLITLAIDTQYYNKIFYQNHYKKLLKKSDINLSISKFTQHCVKKFIGIDSKVWYPGVDSNLISLIPKTTEMKYDAINISRIVPHKNQRMFVEASKKLNLEILIIGYHQDKSIQLDCPHLHLETKEEVFTHLSKAKIYVDPSKFEGFGMTPVEAAFLGKPIVASNTYIHREVLGNLPIYFDPNDITDLIEKLKEALYGDSKPDEKTLNKIKIKYSIQNAKERLLNFIQNQ